MKILILVAIVVGLLFSCKKRERLPAETNSTGGGNNNTTATIYSGILQSQKSFEIYNNTISSSNYYPLAYFSSSPTQYFNLSSYVDIDSVVLNSVRLKWSNYWYTDSTHSISYPNAIWKVYGKNGIPSFTYTNTDVMPDYSNYNEMPDSINKQTGITVPLTGISGYSEATVIISDGSGQLGHTVSKVLANGSSSVSFTPSELINIDITSYGDYYVILKKDNVKKISSQDFNFINQCQFHKLVVLY